MISASHNSFEYNGIKIFSGTAISFLTTLRRELKTSFWENRHFP